MQVDLIAMALEDLNRWDSRLVELVKEEKINPWDIDITLLTERYMQKIREMQKVDFRVPAKAIITAAVLLRLKSENLYFRERPEKEPEEEEKRVLDVPDLRPVKRVVERKVTIFELMEALRGAFEIEKKKISRKRLLTQIVKISLFDMTELLESLKAVLREIFKERRRVSMEELLEYREFNLLFLAVLHLANEGYIELEQEDWNSPIVISEGRGEELEGLKELKKELGMGGEQEQE